LRIKEQDTRLTLQEHDDDDDDNDEEMQAQSAVLRAEQARSGKYQM